MLLCVDLEDDAAVGGANGRPLVIFDDDANAKPVSVGIKTRNRLNQTEATLIIMLSA
jgi:hypothetical protein